mmetsp:Transcript_685/g.1080  ORF Transcript_685/g.1080 Transcript_685/m.1080 type:complete len:101 (-) Transcript_685:962-1264(-)
MVLQNGAGQEVTRRFDSTTKPTRTNGSANMAINRFTVVAIMRKSDDEPSELIFLVPMIVCSAKIVSLSTTPEGLVIALTLDCISWKHSFDSSAAIRSRNL